MPVDGGGADGLSRGLELEGVISTSVEETTGSPGGEPLPTGGERHGERLSLFI